MNPGPGSVQVRGLEKHYGDHLVLDAVTFAVSGGQLGVLTGPNGAGKSTLLRCLAGLTGFVGEIELCGRRLAAGRDQPDLRRDVAYVADEPAFFDELSAWAHAHLVASVWGVKAWESRWRSLLAQLGLAGLENAEPSLLSRGTRHKLALSLAFLHAPRILLLDEPFASLDGVGAAALVELMRQALEGGSAAVVSTHAPELVDSLPTTPLRLVEGQLLAVR
ncbi:MAG: ABC transporter ATP-binding protein [Mycobacteriales bacterium]